VSFLQDIVSRMTEILGKPEEATLESLNIAGAANTQPTPAETVPGQNSGAFARSDLPAGEEVQPIDLLLGGMPAEQENDDATGQSGESEAQGGDSAPFPSSGLNKKRTTRAGAVVPARRGSMARAGNFGVEKSQSGQSIPQVGIGAPTDGRTGERVAFQGILLTAQDGPLKIAPESRSLCALFDSGVWMVSSSHKNSPLVTSVAVQAKRQGYKVNEPTYVTPDVIKLANIYAEKAIAAGRLDENQVRRKIVEMLAAARERGANDIHIEACDGRAKVEFRIDGQLRVWETWTQKEGEQLLSAVWSHASTQSGATANWLEPQAAMVAPGSGPDTITLPEGVHGLRCQWMPLADGGRYLNMRMHYETLHVVGADGFEPDVDSIGYTPEQTALISRLRFIPGGMRIVAGPTNQGKTTTLRLMLNRRMSETQNMLNCLLIEDPPEGGVHGARQLGISAAAKADQREKTFLEIMRSALRLDPDILMLGEVRDLTTATFLFRLSLTGSQVYSTIHVYSALAIPQRLRDLGMEPYLVYDPNLVRGLISQRLCRTVCPHCRIPLRDQAKKDPAAAAMLRRVRAGITLMQGARKTGEFTDYTKMALQAPDLSEVYTANSEGCPHCFRGRTGRTATGEVIEANMKLMTLLSENKLEEARQYWLSPNGMAGLSMIWHGMDKIRSGTCSVEDVETQHGPLATDKEIQGTETIIGAA